jgi:hypothetical protein
VEKDEIRSDVLEENEIRSGAAERRVRRWWLEGTKSMDVHTQRKARR